MRTRAKPLFIALALSAGASLPAFALGSADNTNSMVAPAPDQVYGAAPVTLDTYRTTTTVITPAPSTVIVTPSPGPAIVAPSDDARERASRVTTEEEEHGGTRNRAKGKKERTRERLGLGHDDD